MKSSVPVRSAFGRLAVAVAATSLVACGSSGSDSASTSALVDTSAATTIAVTSAPTPTEPPTTPAPPPTDAVSPSPDSVAVSAPDAAADQVRIVTALADDALEGRDNGTPGASAARDLIIAELQTFAEPFAGGTDAAAYLAPYSTGVNVVGLIPGGDLADQYVVIGAHYDHIGRDCFPVTDGDDICNGATDNAAGVAAALSVGKAIAASGTPRRSILLAFWDEEEDGLLGSAAYVASPLVPLASTVAYVNFDIQGAVLSPALTDLTVLVGAETGGAPLVEAVERAAGESPLSWATFSLVFGQGRSDYANFASAGVPVTFFTDANGPCYHTTGDDLSAVDFDKLAEQALVAEALVRDLMDTDQPPVFVSGLPSATYEDALTMLGVMEMVEPDLGLFPSEVTDFATEFRDALSTMAAEGAEAFDDADIGTLLGGSVTLVSALTERECTPLP